MPSQPTSADHALPECTPGTIPRRAVPALAMLAALLGGCARDAAPTTFAVPTAAAARIRMVCPPGTFVGTMTVNCPQPLPRRPPPAAPDQ